MRAKKAKRRIILDVVICIEYVSKGYEKKREGDQGVRQGDLLVRFRKATKPNPCSSRANAICSSSGHIRVLLFAAVTCFVFY